MMDHLTPLVDKAVDLEYKTTSVDHSPVFINSHEGFGVLSEEIQEALDDLDYIAERIQDMLVAIREQDKYAISHSAYSVYHRAKDAACECVQVAAMAHKMTVTMKYISKEENEDV